MQKHYYYYLIILQKTYIYIDIEICIQINSYIDPFKRVMGFGVLFVFFTCIDIYALKITPTIKPFIVLFINCHLFGCRLQPKRSPASYCSLPLCLWNYFGPWQFIVTEFTHLHNHSSICIFCYLVQKCFSDSITSSKRQDSSKSLQKARPVVLHNNPREIKQIGEKIFIEALRKMSRYNHKFPKFCFVLNPVVIQKYKVTAFSDLELVHLRS